MFSHRCHVKFMGFEHGVF